MVDKTLHWQPEIPGVPVEVSMGKSLVEQVDEKFEKIYAMKPEYAKWDGYSTLFAFFFGVNDILGGTANGTGHTPLVESFVAYRREVEKVCIPF